MKRQKTKYSGVYSRESDSRRFDGKPDVCFDITWKQGRRKVWEKVGWKSEGYTAAMASLVRAERVRVERHGQILPTRDTGLTFGEAWIEYRTRHGAALRGQKQDKSRYDRCLQTTLSGMPLSSITPRTLADLKTSLFQRGSSPQTVHHALALVRRVMNKAREWGLWSGASPFGKGTMPQVDNTRWRWLTHEDAHRLLDALAKRSRRTYRLALFSLHTGARAGEVLALRWQHVDIGARLIHLMDAKAGSRAVFMDDTLARMVEEMGGGRPDEPLFPGRDGKPMQEIPDTFPRTVEALGLNTGIADRRGRVVFHTLRHTFASWLAMDGVSMYEIAQLLGQSEIKMAQRYAKLSPGQMRDSVARLDARFKHAAPPSVPAGPPERPADPAGRTGPRRRP